MNIGGYTFFSQETAETVAVINADHKLMPDMVVAAGCGELYGRIINQFKIFRCYAAPFLRDFIQVGQLDAERGCLHGGEAAVEALIDIVVTDV